MSANVFLENSWCWRGISDWNDAPGCGRAEHLFLLSAKNTRDPQELCPLFNFWVHPGCNACCWISDFYFFFLMPVLQKLPHPFYELSNNPCSPILACKGPSRYSRWSWGLTIKKQFLQNTGGGVRRTDVREAVWLSDMRVFVFLCWPVVVWILSDQNWTLGYIYCLNTFIVFL